MQLERWQQAALGAVALVALMLAVTRVPALRRRRFAPGVALAAREGAIVLVLFVLWQLVARVAIRHVAGAFEHAHTVLHIERLLHLPSDLAIQRLVLPYPHLVESLNVYYLYAHLNGMVLFLVWMFVRHRDVYPRARNAIVIVTAACLVIQTVPVAPPRMLTDLGFVDTALVYGQSVYGPFGSGMANQLAAMPSVHVAWALVVAYFVVTASTSRWRWLVLLHPVLTVFVVVATANHFLLDGVVAAMLLALTLLALAAWDRRLPATPEPRPAEMAETGAPDGVRP